MPDYAKKLVFAVAVILLSSSFVFSLNISEEEQRIFDLVNRERRKNNFEELGWNNKLAETARNYSERMAREKLFSHRDSDGNLVENRVLQSNLKKFDKIGENLFFCAGYDKVAKFAVSRWLLSATHRANMFDEEFSETGIGIAVTRRGEVYITQIFLTP